MPNPIQNMKIREALISDASVIRDFQIAMALETENLKLDSETVNRGVQEVFRSGANRGKYFVALNDDSVIGCLLTVPEWSDWRNGEILWIHSVYVHPKHRGRGVYGELYNHLVQIVRTDPNLHGLRLYVERRNLSAQKVYQRHKMSKEHYELYEWLKNS